MPKAPARPAILFILCITALLSLFGCGKKASPLPSTTATITSTSTETPTLTITPTSTSTHTKTPANTITPRPSNSPTVTLTPFPTLTLTPSPTQAPLEPAVLFPYHDINGREVDWSYAHITQINSNRIEELNDLWAFMAFQLQDRAIHSRNFEFLDETITVYFLNVVHDFNGKIIPMQLVLGGTPGESIAIKDIPAGGTAYIQVQVRDSGETFDPYIVHIDANRDYALRENDFPLMFLKDLQSLLPTLPEGIILLADHPILFPKNDWQQIKLDMGRVAYLAARYQPFFEFDDFDRLVDQSDFAYALSEYLLLNRDMSEGYYAFSSKTLIIIKDEE